MSTLELRKVTFSYGKKTVMSDCSLSFASHERVALSAPSGFGKTTLCRLLAGYAAPQQGEVLLDGEPLGGVRRSGARSVRRASFAEKPAAACPVQLIGQHPEHMLDPLLRIGSSLKEAGSIDEDLLRQLGIRDEWLSRFPRELSGGELQRCCIARALRVEPRFLIADEISTMLDAVTQVQIWQVLLDYCYDREVGLVLVTHSDALMKRLATRVVDLAHLS